MVTGDARRLAWTYRLWTPTDTDVVSGRTCGERTGPWNAGAVGSILHLSSDLTAVKDHFPTGRHVRLTTVLDPVRTWWPMKKPAVLSNYLWIPQESVRGTPSDFAPEWEYEFKLKDTAQGKLAAQQIAYLREQAIMNGEDPDEAAQEILDSDTITIRTWSKVGKWWALCGGNRDKVRDLCQRLGLEIKDQRVSAPWPEDVAAALKMVMTLRPNQVEPLQTWLRADGGVFVASPAYGKTVTMCAAIIARQQWTVVLVHTDQLAEQFLLRFREGSPKTQSDGSVDYNRVTNCLEVEKQLGRTVAGRWNGKDLYPVTVATWQAFSNDAGKRALKDISERVGNVLADESLPADASVLTPNGYRRIDSISEGDTVLSYCQDSDTFEEKTVYRTWVHRPRSAMVRVTHEHGSFDCTGNHRVLTSTGYKCALALTSSDRILCYGPGLTAEDEPRRRLRDGGCVPNATAQREGRANPLQPWAEARSLGAGQIRGDKGLGSHRTQDSDERWVRRLPVYFPDDISSRDIVRMAQDVSSGEEEYRPGLDLGVLEPGNAVLVANGRRQPGEWLLHFSHAGVRRQRSPRSIGVFRRKEPINESGGGPEREAQPSPTPGVVKGPSEDGATIFHSSDGLQSRPGTRPRDVRLRAVRAGRRQSRESTWNTPILPSAPVSKSPASHAKQPLNLRGSEGNSEQLSVPDVQRTPVSFRESRRPAMSVLSGVKRVDHVVTPTLVYDLSVDKNHNFVVNGAVLHNCHVFSAPVAAKVTNSFKAKYKSGVTATDQRKDGLEVALYDTLGPVTAEGKAEQLDVTAFMIFTGCKYTPRRFPGPGEWAQILNWLAKQTDRNDLIAEWVHEDLKHGRNILLISDRVKWCYLMAERLKKEGVKAKAVTGGMNSKKGQAERQKAIDDMGTGRLNVICATSVFKAGLDIPVLDTLYATGPMNNAPQLEQVVGRIRRSHPGKKHAVFRYFADDGHGLLYGCARGTAKSLTQMGIQVIPVAIGTKPSRVNQPGLLAQAAKPVVQSFDEEDDEEDDVKATSRQVGGLRRHAVKSTSALDQFFADLKAEVKETEKYQRRLGRK